MTSFFLIDRLLGTLYYLKLIAGWSSLVARRAHNPKVGGSNPLPATKIKSRAYIE